MEYSSKSACYLIKNDYEEEKGYIGWINSSKTRLFPNNENIKFDGKIHELVEKSVNIKIEETKIEKKERDAYRLRFLLILYHLNTIILTLLLILLLLYVLFILCILLFGNLLILLLT